MNNSVTETVLRRAIFLYLTIIEKTFNDVASPRHNPELSIELSNTLFDAYDQLQPSIGRGIQVNLPRKQPMAPSTQPKVPLPQITRSITRPNVSSRPLDTQAGTDASEAISTVAKRDRISASSTTWPNSEHAVVSPFVPSKSSAFAAKFLSAYCDELSDTLPKDDGLGVQTPPNTATQEVVGHESTEGSKSQVEDDVVIAPGRGRRYLSTDQPAITSEDWDGTQESSIFFPDSSAIGTAPGPAASHRADDDVSECGTDALMGREPLEPVSPVQGSAAPAVTEPSVPEPEVSEPEFPGPQPSTLPTAVPTDHNEGRTVTAYEKGLGTTVSSEQVMDLGGEGTDTNDNDSDGSQSSYYPDENSPNRPSLKRKHGGDDLNKNAKRPNRNQQEGDISIPTLNRHQTLIPVDLHLFNQISRRFVEGGRYDIFSKDLRSTDILFNRLVENAVPLQKLTSTRSYGHFFFRYSEKDDTWNRMTNASDVRSFVKMHIHWPHTESKIGEAQHLRCMVFLERDRQLAKRALKG